MKIGEILYEEVISRNNPSEIKERIITKIGNKYFYVNNDERTGFSKNDFCYIDKQYTQFNRKLYPSKAEIEDKNKRLYLIDKFEKLFSYRGERYNLTLDQLLKID